MTPKDGGRGWGRVRRGFAAVGDAVVALVAVEGVILAAMIVYVRAEFAGDEALGPVRFLPYAILAAGFFLSWRFRRSRLLFGLVVIAMADRALVSMGPGPAVPGTLVFQAIAVLLPINLTALSVVTERGTLTVAGLRRITFIVAQILLVWGLSTVQSSGAVGFLQWSVLPTSWFQWTVLGPPALMLYGLGTVLLSVRIVVSPNATGRGFLWAIIASFLALNAGIGTAASTLYFSAAGLVLVVSVVEASYFMAYRDGLTGLPARRALNEALLRLHGQYTIAMVDIDHFKNVNDRYGHDVGDQVLRMVASRLGSVGGGGKAYRYGGEEFALVFSDHTADAVLPHLESLRGLIETTQFTVRGPDRPATKPEGPKPVRNSRRRITVTVSIGAAARSDRRSAPSEVIGHADKTLYKAKKAGRNRVVVWRS